MIRYRGPGAASGNPVWGASKRLPKRSRNAASSADNPHVRAHPASPASVLRREQHERERQSLQS